MPAPSGEIVGVRGGWRRGSGWGGDAVGESEGLSGPLVPRGGPVSEAADGDGGGSAFGGESCGADEFGSLAEATGAEGELDLPARWEVLGWRRVGCASEEAWDGRVFVGGRGGRRG